MPELATTKPFLGSDPVLEITELFPTSVFMLGSSGTVIFTPTGQGLWRVRSVNVVGTFTGTAGTNSLSLEMFLGFQSGAPNVGLQFVSVVPYDFGPGDMFSVTWSTEVGASYGGQVNANFGRSFNLGIPLLYIGQGTSVNISSRKNAGSDIDVFLEGGSMQVEYFPSGSVSIGGSAEFNLYLQPQ